MKIRFLLFFLFLTYSSLSQENNKARTFSPDIQLNTCLDSSSNQTTYGMMECTGRARDAWDAEMNNYYKKLMDVLKPEEKEKLKASQKKWLEYRNAEFETSTAVYYGMEGTMWKISAVSRQMEIVRQRALDLMSYYEDLTMKNE
jgi:uncharacterized protein YecT (DUF1311 family)